MALLGNYVAKPSNGWYCRVDKETGELLDPKVREKDTKNAEFWDPIFKETDFKEFLTNSYTIGHKSMFDTITLEGTEDATPD